MSITKPSKLPSVQIPQGITFISSSPSKQSASNKTTIHKVIPEGTFTRYLDAWKYKRTTGCKREIKRTGYNEYKV